jgi:hypothetical protein
MYAVCTSLKLVEIEQFLCEINVSLFFFCLFLAKLPADFPADKAGGSVRAREDQQGAFNLRRQAARPADRQMNCCATGSFLLTVHLPSSRLSVVATYKSPLWSNDA